MADNFYTSHCPVCRSSALEAGIRVSNSRFECARCGAFDITQRANRQIRRLGPAKRDAWLHQARQEMAGRRGVALISTSNSPLTHGRLPTLQ